MAAAQRDKDSQETRELYSALQEAEVKYGLAVNLYSSRSEAAQKTRDRMKTRRQNLRMIGPPGERFQRREGPRRRPRRCRWDATRFCPMSWENCRRVYGGGLERGWGEEELWLWFRGLPRLGVTRIGALKRERESAV